MYLNLCMEGQQTLSLIKHWQKSTEAGEREKGKTSTIREMAGISAGLRTMPEAGKEH